MTKRIILSLVAATLVAIPAQTAAAAIPAGPTQQEMDHGVQPTVESGYGDYADETTAPDPSEPEPTEPVPTPAEQGISTSPGAVEPEVTAPDVPEPQQAKDEGADEESVECEAIAAGKAKLREQLFLVGSWMFYFEGTHAGALLEDVFEALDEEFNQVKEDAESFGCDETEGETAE